MFRLTTEEWASLRSQIATLRMGHGQHRKYLPLASEVSVYVVRAFVRLREVLASNVDVARRLAPPSTKPRPIGFVVPKEQG